jgi:threonyl-tRNA synthetase
MRLRLDRAGYQEVKTPQLVDRALWVALGPLDQVRRRDVHRCPRAESAKAEEEHRIYALKPMNCPCHVQIFRQGLKSYRDLPLRMAEFGSCHRYEPSGALHGIMRVRGFTQDDAHIFCTEDQITPESIAFCDLLRSIYKDLGFDDVRVKFSDRPAMRAGEDAIWDKAETALRQPPRPPASRSSTTRARARSTAPSSSSCCAMRSAGTGSAAPCRSTSSCPSGSTRAISARTASATGR